MATPEQNALLAMQLFSPVAEQFNAQNDARTNLLYKLTMANREEQLKRDLTNQGDERAFELARYAADREDTRQLGAEKRQKNQLDALQTREDTRVTEAERRQNAALDARERQQVISEMNRLYPQYAAAAARAGIEIKQRADFAETNEGLGQLAADLKTAEVGFEGKKLRGAADAIMAEYEDGRRALDDARKRLDTLGNPSKEDEKFARTRAVSALKQAIEAGSIQSAMKLSKKAIADGLSALAKGDDAIAAGLLGEEAIGAFQGAIEQTLMALPNTKSRLQERAQAQQQLLALQTQVSRIESDVRKSAAGNPFLAEQFKSKSPLRDLMTPAEPVRRKTFDEVTPAARGSTPAARGTPQNAQPATSGTNDQDLSRVENILRSRLGLDYPAVSSTTRSVMPSAPTLVQTPQSNQRILELLLSSPPQFATPGEENVTPALLEMQRSLSGGEDLGDLVRRIQGLPQRFPFEPDSIYRHSLEIPPRIPRFEDQATEGFQQLVVR